MGLTDSLQIGRHCCGLEHFAQSDGGLLLSPVMLGFQEENG